MTHQVEPRIETRTTLQIINQEGTISWPGGGGISVYFNLIEMQDFHNGVSGRKYSYGNLRFRDHLESSVVLLFLSRTRLILTGGGIQTAVCLYGLNSFTVMGAIRQIHTARENVAA
jgi:hypothetical protein